MDKPRIVLCGSPGAGKKRLLFALAQHVGTSTPMVVPATATMPARVSWEALFPGGAVATLAALHGPGFTYEDAVGDLFSMPVAVVLYVLSQKPSRFEQSWRDLEMRSFHTYSATARVLKRIWNNVPWLFVRHGAESSDAKWMTEVIPAELLGSTIAVDSVIGHGLEDLSKAIEGMLRSPALRR